MRNTGTDERLKYLHLPLQSAMQRFGNMTTYAIQLNMQLYVFKSVIVLQTTSQLREAQKQLCNHLEGLGIREGDVVLQDWKDEVLLVAKGISRMCFLH